MRIHVREGDIHLLDLRTRMPFKYGIATMTSTPHAFVRLRVEIDGQLLTGIAADHLPPKWFTKDPTRPIADEIADMLRVIEHARSVAVGLRGGCAFDVWQQVWDMQASWGRAQQLPALLTHFGTSLVERALIEAVCRQAQQPFAQALRSNRFGIRPGDVHPALKDLTPSAWLPERPLPCLVARHTIGLADPLTDADIAPAERLADGLPQSLAACIRVYGLRHFKVKVNGDLAHDRERLRRIADVIREHGPLDFGISLDGNEQFRDVATFRGYWSELLEGDGFRHFFEHLLFVEQPFHREVALEEAAVGPLRGWANRPPMIIDESDGDLQSLAQALTLGYAGTSHKNCKGVFKSVLNAGLVHLHQGRAILSGEDLANIGPVALLQDLAVCASLGIRSVERNGHHYFAGLSMFPETVQRQVLAMHDDLYHAGRDGWPTLSIRNGEIELRSLAEAPFGVGFELEVAPFAPLTSYRPR